MSKELRVDQARALLSTQKLVFGNDEQIRARNLLMAQCELLEYVDQHKDLLTDCIACNGTGEREYYDSDRDRDYTDECDDCNGTGTLRFTLDNTSRMTRWDLECAMERATEAVRAKE